MNDDLISRKAAIDEIRSYIVEVDEIRSYICDNSENEDDVFRYNSGLLTAIQALNDLPPAQLETSRIEKTLHGKSSEEQYEFLRWLMQDYGMQFTDTRVAVIEWLRGK